MRIGVSHLIVPDLSLEDFFTTSAAAGYEVVELVMRREGALTPHTPEPELKRIAQAARDAGVAPVSMCHSHLTGNLLESGDAQRRGIDETVLGLRAAAAMGIDCTLHTLGRLSPVLYYDDAYRNAVASLKELAETCESLGVAIAIEFVWNGFCFSPLEMRRLIEDVGSRMIGFYFDPGNMAVFNFPQHWARILGPNIKRVHLKDWKGTALNGEWPALLTGTIDFPAVMHELRAAGYDGPLISEVVPTVASLESTAQAMRKIAAM